MKKFTDESSLTDNETDMISDQMEQIMSAYNKIKNSSTDVKSEHRKSIRQMIRKAYKIREDVLMNMDKIAARNI